MTTASEIILAVAAGRKSLLPSDAAATVFSAGDAVRVTDDDGEVRQGATLISVTGDMWQCEFANGDRETFGFWQLEFADPVAELKRRIAVSMLAQDDSLWCAGNVYAFREVGKWIEELFAGVKP